MNIAIDGPAGAGKSTIAKKERQRNLVLYMLTQVRCTEQSLYT